MVLCNVAINYCKKNRYFLFWPVCLRAFNSTITPIKYKQRSGEGCQNAKKNV